MKKLISLVLVTAFGNAYAGPLFSSSTLNADTAFTDGLSGTTMTMTYSNGKYYTSSGGSAAGVHLAQYSAAGAKTGTYSPGLDFRSVFSDNSGNVLAREFASNTIYKMSSPGVFASAITLGGAGLNAQSSVDMNDAGQFVANDNGNIRVWSANGTQLSSFNLNGYSSANYPANRGVAAAGNFLLTYDSGNLKAWNYSGALLDSVFLNLGGSSFDSNFSLSYANNRVFVVSNAGGTWHGYNLGLAATAVPEPSTVALIGLALAGLALSRRRASKQA